jgi:hypothetical protein
MYDDHKLRRSESYFMVIQLLRVFRDWVNTAHPGLRELSDEWENCIKAQDYTRSDDYQNAQNIIVKNWETLLSYSQDLTDQLLSHIDRTTEEVISLRDGVNIGPDT